MIYLIDTNIAYYLSGISKDENFNKDDFIDNSIPKLISSISIVELYLKNDFKVFKSILNKLCDYKIDLVIFGNNLRNTENVSIKKLAKKPNSYLKRMMEYFKEISMEYTANSVMYLGFLIGGMYTYLLNLRNNDKKIKNVDFVFITLKNNSNTLLDLIKKDIYIYYNSKKEEDCNKIFLNVRTITLMAIADYLYKKNKNKIDKTQIEYFNKIENIKLDCYKLMINVCNSKNLKPKAVLSRFYKSLNTNQLDFLGLESIVSYLFLNNKLKWNDLTDFNIISIAERITDCAVITSDKNKQQFLKENINDNECAKLSCQELLKFYKRIGL